MVYQRLTARPSRPGPSLGDGFRAVVLLLLMVSAVAMLPRWFGEETITGDVEIIDGDSLRIAGREVRLEGIDAPELEQTCERDGRSYPCGRLAKRALADLRAAGTARCRLSGTDRYGRGLGRCSVGDNDLNAALVRAGWAIAYGAYRREEDEARQARRGVWAGSFQRPSNWRQRHPRGGG